MNARPTKDREHSPLDITPQQVESWRERLHYSQRDAAHALGCSRSAWSNWETGAVRVPRYIALAMAAIALGIRPYGEAQTPTASEIGGDSNERRTIKNEI